MKLVVRHTSIRAGFFCSVIVLASSILAPVCANAIPLPKKDEAKKISQLETKLKEQQALITELREKNLVLTSKVEQEKKIRPVPFDPSARVAMSDDDLAGVAPSVSWPATAEYMLYSKVIDSYQKRRVPDLERSTQLLLKGYPQSIYGDNALYLQARLQVSTGAYQQALDSIDHIEKQFPDGDKKVSALFLKGEIYSHMKQNAKAQEAFKLVARLFPGSPESLQLDRQLAQGDKN